MTETAGSTKRFASTTASTGNSRRAGPVEDAGVGRATFATMVETLVGLGYPELLATTPDGLRTALAPLQDHAPMGEIDLEAGSLPFVLVIAGSAVPAAASLTRIRREGRAPVEALQPVPIERFVPIDTLELPAGEAYLLLDVDRGDAFRNATPDAAYQAFAEMGRSPLTIEEGIAVLTHHPDVLRPNRCFSLLGSRCGDKRVPAIWLSRRRPKLGWCWAGNPHTWLGSASGAGRSPGVAIERGREERR